MTYNIKNSTTRIFIVLVMALSCFAMNAQRLSNTNEHNRGTVEQQMANSALNYTGQKVDALLKLAFSFRGTPYVYGASRPGAFDCSGFTSYVFRQFGYNLDRTSGGQANNGRSVSRNELKPGDLVFFNGRALGSRIGHVGIVTSVGEDGDFEFIHSSNSKGVVVSSSDEPYYKRRYVKACRVLSQVQESNDVKPFQLFDVSTWK